VALVIASWSKKSNRLESRGIERVLNSTSPVYSRWIAFGHDHNFGIFFFVIQGFFYLLLSLNFDSSSCRRVVDDYKQPVKDSQAEQDLKHCHHNHLDLCITL
jgi:hypothetical protein